MTSTTKSEIWRAKQHLAAGNAGAAREELERCAAAATLEPDERRLLVQCLTQTGDLNAAIDQQRPLVPADIASCDDQGRADALTAARLAQMAMYYSDAADLARQLVAANPADVAAANLLATLVLWTDGPEASRAALAAVLTYDQLPPHLLAETLAFYDDPPASLIARVIELSENSALLPQSRADLLLALAQYHDRSGQYDKAWTLAERGNAAAPQRTGQDWRGLLSAHLAIYRSSRSVTESTGPSHLYLLGTPRSGQSLIQSVLSASPGVFSMGERGALLQHILYRTGDIVRQSSAQREIYFTDLAASDNRGIIRLAGQPRAVVDKSPLHLPVAGSVARIHPAAAFAAVLRDPADTAMSIWLRSFPPIYDYANDFGAILDQLDFALDAIAAWQEAGLTIRLIDHAALIADPAQECRSLFEWMALEWDDSYLQPGSRTQPVPTFSAAQVRQPISKTVARSAEPYADKMSQFSGRIDDLRAKTAALLEQNRN